jgi:hypoxanthine phosphoribosyltransferase
MIRWQWADMDTSPEKWSPRYPWPAVSPVEHPAMRPRPLIRASTIRRRLASLGHEIARAYAGRAPTLLVLMDGAFCFSADLVRAIPLTEVELIFRRASSYRGMTSTGTVVMESLPDLRGAHILVVDDILDTGQTLAQAVAAVRLAGAETIATCVLLDKPARRVATGLRRADFTGFTIPDAFVVGYGLDYAGRWRGLPDLCVIDPVLTTPGSPG